MKLGVIPFTAATVTTVASLLTATIITTSNGFSFHRLQNAILRQNNQKIIQQHEDKMATLSQVTIAKFKSCVKRNKSCNYSTTFAKQNEQENDTDSIMDDIMGSVEGEMMKINGSSINSNGAQKKEVVSSLVRTAISPPETHDKVLTVEAVGLSIPYDAAAKLAYEASDKSTDYVTFKAKYEADAVTNVIAKRQIDGFQDEQEEQMKPIGSSEEEIFVAEHHKNWAFEERPTFEQVSSKMSDSIEKIQYSSLGKAVNGVTNPFFGPEIEKGVSSDTIKGALVLGVALTFLTNNFDPKMAVVMALTTAYVTITPGKTGNVARAFGDATWDTSTTLLRATKSVLSALGLQLPFLKEVEAELEMDWNDVNGQSVDETTIVDEDIAYLVEEAKETVAEVENALSNSDTHAEVDEELLAEEARRLEIEYLMEEARIEKEAYQAEEEFHVVEERLAEEARLAEEERLAEEDRIADEERLAEEARIAEELLVEETRLAEEARIAEEERLAEEARLAEEDNITEDSLLDDEADDDDFIDEMEWEASINLAEDIGQDEEPNEEYANEWNAARKLANDLKDEPEVDFDYDAPGLTDDERIELIAKAARAAVEKFELEQKEEEEMVQKKKELRNVMKIEVQEADILDAPTFELADGKEEGNNESLSGVNYKKLTVTELKDILRSRGLKVSGRKAELIARLESQ